MLNQSQKEMPTYTHMGGSEGHRSNVPIGTVLITVQPPLEENPVILVFHEQLIGQGDDIDVISCNQVRSYGHSVDDRATTFGGLQRITLHESGTILPLELRKALISLKFRKPSQPR